MEVPCPICAKTALRVGLDRDAFHFSCGRCGNFDISGSAEAMLSKPKSFGRSQRARLSHAVRKLSDSGDLGTIMSDHLAALSAAKLPSPVVQEQLALQWLSQKLDEDYMGSTELDDEDLAGAIGALDGDGAHEIIMAAHGHGWVRYVPDDEYGLTVDGWAQVSEGKPMAVPSAKPNLVFLGHGQSLVWRDLKDYLRDRLDLRVDEFNLQAAAGMTIASRLEQMLDAATFAFIVMTAEDATPSGLTNARLNVVHELGLFQGRLGFMKAIVLLEDGCEEFSNIHGLVQVRFPKGDIDPVKDQIRHILERENIVKRA